MTDSYFTPARREDREALQFEPYRGHRIVEHGGDDGFRYQTDHDVFTRHDTAQEVRMEIDRCVDHDRAEGCDVKPEGDIFARFYR